jgi:hypothetical protein
MISRRHVEFGCCFVCFGSQNPEKNPILHFSEHIIILIDEY